MPRHPIVRLVIASAVAVLSAAAARAQQFQEQSGVIPPGGATTRFPQPDPLDYSNQLTIGDLDNDGDLDIVWANGGNFSTPGSPLVARIYINNGSGVFTDESAARGAVSGLFRGVELGDIDNDGDLDIVLAPDFATAPRLLLNNGTGVFADVSAARLPAMTLGSARAQFADIDNDGDLDLYFVNGVTSRAGTGRGRLLLNDGAGFFTEVTATNTPNQTTAEPMDCIFADVDGDFDLDLRISSTAASQSKLYINNGAGVFSDGSGSVPADNNCYSYDFGDIDGDGDLDMLGANGSPVTANAEILLRNNGAGLFTDISANLSPNPAQDDNDSKFLDYDMDGDLDLFIAHIGSGGEKIYSNNGAGVFTQVAGLITVLSDTSLDIKVADLDNDGRYDLVTAQGESGSFRNRLYMNVTGPVDNRPPRIVATETLPSQPAGPASYVVRAAVLDDMTSDRNFFHKAMELRYTVNGGPEQIANMRYSGGQIYRGVIPPINACGGLVQYYVRAVDWANNVAVGPTRTFTVAAGTQSGDINADTLVDAADATLLVAVLVGIDTTPAHVARSDMDCSGQVNGDDVAPFVAALFP
ncbi:MAG: FG-GAP-like repeat-containing protein [Phycisphaerae bacterium]